MIPTDDGGVTGRRLNPAKWFVERIEEHIGEAQRERPADIVFARAILPGGQRIQVSFFGYHGPDMLILHGYDQAGHECRVLAAYSAVHILVEFAVNEPAKARPTMIGFQTSGADTKGTAKP